MRVKLGNYIGAGVMFVSVSTLVQPVHAGRATRDQIAEAATEAMKLWAAPGTNYNAIYSCLIKPGTISRADLLDRLNPMLEKAEEPQVRAALNYLLGETHYWGALSELRKTKSRSAVLNVGDNVVRSFLAAWEAVETAEETIEAAKLRDTIVFRFNQLLGTALCGGNLSEDLKHKVVARYIDRLNVAQQTSAAWPLAQRGRVYANLGIQSRMTAHILTTMPTNFTSACETMNLAWCARATNEALRLASLLEEKYEPELSKRPAERRAVFNVYRACGDSRALPCLEALVAGDPRAWLDFYDFAVRRDPSISPAQRKSYIDKYFEGVKWKDGELMSGYRGVLERLVGNGDYALATRIAFKAVNDTAAVGGSCAENAYVWRLKAIAHEKLGEKNRAVEGFRKALELAPMIDGEGVGDLFRNDLKRVEDQNKGAGGQDEIR